MASNILEHKDSDSPELRALKSFWQMAMSLPVAERRVFLQEDRVSEAERTLQLMIDSNKSDDIFIAACIAKARNLVLDYEMHGVETWLGLAEKWAEVARSVKQCRYSIGDIRQQREKIQWEKKKLQMIKQDTEPKHS